MREELQQHILEKPEGSQAVIQWDMETEKASLSRAGIKAHSSTIIIPPQSSRNRCGGETGRKRICMNFLLDQEVFYAEDTETHQEAARILKKRADNEMGRTEHRPDSRPNTALCISTHIQGGVPNGGLSQKVQHWSDRDACHISFLASWWFLCGAVARFLNEVTGERGEKSLL